VNNKIEGDFDANGRRVLSFLNGKVEFSDHKGADITPNKTTLLNNFKEEYFKFMLYRHGIVNN
tara:strand:- start:2511 stop:2699 length:189 start_codon:yes stop_codon:yes gene_type:complete